MKKEKYEVAVRLIKDMDTSHLLNLKLNDLCTVFGDLTLIELLTMVLSKHKEPEK